MTARVTSLSEMQRAYRDLDVLNELLEDARAKFNLVSPAASCGALPEGCSIALTAVIIDSDLRRGDVYKVRGDEDQVSAGDRLGLTKTALDRIAAGAGISWDGQLSRRTDDASDPHYCAYKAVGSYLHFDGRECQIQGEKAMDLRDGSPQLLTIRQRAASRQKNPDSEIRELRQHILEHAETKARLRAIRALGIRTSYTREEIAKPFVIARLMWSGETKDAELRRAFALLHAQTMLSGRRALYGAPDRRLFALPEPPPRIAPDVDQEDAEEAAPAKTAVSEIAPAAPVAAEPAARAPEPAPVPCAAPAASPSSDDSRGKPAAGGVWTIPAGREKGVPLHRASARQLTYWAGRLETDVREGRSFNVSRDEARALAMRAELQRRSAGTPKTNDGDKF
jgi:hypothetical protein